MVANVENLNLFFMTLGEFNRIMVQAIKSFLYIYLKFMDIDFNVFYVMVEAT